MAKRHNTQKALHFGNSDSNNNNQNLTSTLCCNNKYDNMQWRQYRNVDVDVADDDDDDDGVHDDYIDTNVDYCCVDGITNVLTIFGFW